MWVQLRTEERGARMRKKTRPPSSRLELADCLEHSHVILNLILLYCCDLNSSHNLYNEAGCTHECFMWEMVQELQEKELCLPPELVRRMGWVTWGRTRWLIQWQGRNSEWRVTGESINYSFPCQNHKRHGVCMCQRMWVHKSPAPCEMTFKPFH